MTHENEDKRGNREFEGFPDRAKRERDEARLSKENRAKTEQGQRTFLSRKTGGSHKGDRG